MIGGSTKNGPLARVPAGYKFAFLFVAGIGVYLLRDTGAQLAALAAALVIAGFARVGAARLLRAMSGLLIIAAVVFVTMALAMSPSEAVTATLRLLTLCVLAYTVTLTTGFSETLDLFERLLRPFRHVGLNPAQVSLALSMTLRFIPEIRTKYFEIREAQHARGLGNSPMAVLVPLIVRTLESASEVASAIDARCYDSAERGTERDGPRRALRAPNGSDPI
ncbi:CbiQ family ECF transporter T component [Marinactinospora endophytica]